MTIFLATFMPELENKLYIVMLICLYIFYVKEIGLANRNSFLIVNFLLIVYTVWTMVNSGFSYVIHLDYYAYIGLALTLLIFSKEEILENLKDYLEHHANLIILTNVGYFLILAASIPLRGGLHTGFNMRIPILYGPYSIPHDVAYECLFLYCLNAFMYKRKHTTNFLIFKCICLVCITWTATRSAFLAMVVIVFLDYCAYRNVQKKFLLIVLALAILLCLALFTDVLLVNPITQKTMAAIRDTGTASNGRGYFAKVALNGYINNTNIIQKIFGMGIESVRNTLKEDPLVKVAIHAHNDYVNILCGYGIIGLGILICQQIKLVSLWKIRTFGVLVEIFLTILIYTNGLAMYCIVTPLLPILFIFSQECCNQKVRGLGVSNE